MDESEEAQGSDGEEDLSIDFSDLMLSESPLKIPKFQVQFDTSICISKDKSKNEQRYEVNSGGLSEVAVYNKGAQDIHSQLLVEPDGHLKELDQLS